MLAAGTGKRFKLFVVDLSTMLLEKVDETCRLYMSFVCSLGFYEVVSWRGRHSSFNYSVDDSHTEVTASVFKACKFKREHRGHTSGFFPSVISGDEASSTMLGPF